ncbi:Mu-like prophage major head subunit gpT family protein, partial [Arthrospira platensis SPKY1]|nr:Mu-like prophage major head subunit gpT family protein [Arthrospira platensis SPKY1]
MALFHGTHGNLSTSAALIDAVSMDPEVIDPIAEMREKMLLQKGLEGRYITVRPRFLLVPPRLESAALKVTNAAIVAASARDANLLGPSLTPIVEPRLQDGSATA